MIIQARLDFARHLAEAQHDAEFVRLDAEEAGKAPQHDGAERQQRKAAAAEIAARQHAAQLVLAAAQNLFQIGRRRTLTIADPSPRGPWDLSPTVHRPPDCSTALKSLPRDPFWPAL